MLRKRVVLTETTVVAQVANQVASECRRLGIDAESTSQLVADLSTAASALLERSRQVTSVGGQAVFRRVIEGPDVRIELVVRANDRRTLFERLWDRVRG